MSFRALFQNKGKQFIQFLKSSFLLKIEEKILQKYFKITKTKQNEPQQRIGIGFLCCQCFIVSNYALAKLSGIFIRNFSKAKSAF